MEEKASRIQLKCRRCGRWLPLQDFLLCDICYQSFFSWASRRFQRLVQTEENALEVWLREMKEKD